MNKIPSIHQEYYKIENWILQKINLDEKKSKEYYKKYITYKGEGFTIYNFDYNLIKPYVVRLLQLKGYFEDYNKITIIIIVSVLFVIVGLFYYNNHTGSEKLNKLSNIYNTKVDKLKNDLNFIKNNENKLYYIMNQVYSGKFDNLNNNTNSVKPF